MKRFFARRAAERGSYTVHVNNSAGIVSGIVRVQLQTDDPALAEAPVEFSVDVVAPGVAATTSKRVVPGQAQESWIALHSHLLDNGNCTIRWRAANDGGEVKVRIRNQGELAQRVRDQLARDGVELFLTGPCDSAVYTYDNPELLPWYDREDCHELLDTMLADGRVAPELEGPFRQFLDEGWFEVENHVDSELLERLNADMDHAAAAGDSGFTPGSSQRLQRMHLKYQSFWDVTTYPATRELIDQVMQVPSTVCQIIGFVNGTQQAAHQDTIHLTVFPRGYMCGAWLALEDIQPDSGELIVYPGSHRWPPVLMQDFDIPKVQEGHWADFSRTVVRQWQALIDEHAVQPFIYRPKAGSLLVWHDRLMHGGSTRTDESLTRKSCVTHHFAQGGIIYYDSTGLPGKVIERDERRVLAR